MCSPWRSTSSGRFSSSWAAGGWLPCWCSIVLFLLVADLIRRSAAIDWKAALALVPYLLWLGVAGYLNLGIYLLNR